LHVAVIVVPECSGGERHPRRHALLVEAAVDGSRHGDLAPKTVVRALINVQVLLDKIRKIVIGLLGKMRGGLALAGGDKAGDVKSPAWGGGVRDCHRVRGGAHTAGAEPGEQGSTIARSLRGGHCDAA
jgi:hypothetical protein